MTAPTSRSWRRILPIVFVIASLFALVLLPIFIRQRTSRIRSEMQGAIEPARTATQAVARAISDQRALLTEQPELVTKVVRAMMKAIRLIKSDRKYSIDFLKGPWLDIGKDPEKIAARVYDAAAPALLDNGSVSLEIQREMIADASVRVKPKQPVLPEQVFDFSIVEKVSRSLR